MNQVPNQELGSRDVIESMVLMAICFILFPPPIPWWKRIWYWLLEFKDHPLLAMKILWWSLLCGLHKTADCDVEEV